MPFTPDSIRRWSRYHQPQIQGCYEETLADKDKVVEGKLLTSFIITAEGLVKNAKVAEEGHHAQGPQAARLRGGRAVGDELPQAAGRQASTRSSTRST